eukprot:scaffold49553_cov30-Tisochrysis_lutea.AAC.1
MHSALAAVYYPVDGDGSGWSNGGSAREHQFVPLVATPASILAAIRKFAEKSTILLAVDQWVVERCAIEAREAEDEKLLAALVFDHRVALRHTLPFAAELELVGHLDRDVSTSGGIGRERKAILAGLLDF